MKTDICIDTIYIWKILGVILLIIKTIIPIILIGGGIKETVNVITSKNPEKIQPSVISFIKKLLAGILVFLLPVLIDSTMKMFVNFNESKYYKCKQCLIYPNYPECDSYIQEYKDSKEYVEREDIEIFGGLETEELTELRKEQASDRINSFSNNNQNTPDVEPASKIYQKYNKEVEKEEPFVDNATNGPINENVKAIGIDGGVRIVFNKVEGVKSYIVVARDYNGKIHKAMIPNNINDEYKHDYQMFKYNVAGVNYWDVRKLSHNYKIMNTWMDNNNKIYQFKLNAYKDSNGQVELSHSEWIDAVPFNVEKDVPELNIILPDRYTLTDPEDPKLNGVGFGSKAVKKKDMKRLDFVRIEENDGNVELTWNNTIPGFTIEKQTIEYQTYADGSSQIGVLEKEELSSTESTHVINGLNNETTYIVFLTAEGTYDGKKVTMQATEYVIPHTKSTRRRRLGNVRRGNPQAGSYSFNSYLTKGDAEAFANYGRNGSAFKSNTDYFIWVNLYELRAYIFRKDQSKEWRLWKDTACGIGGNRNTTPGLWTINGKEWIWVWQPGNKDNSTFTPDKSWWNPNSNMTAVQWLVNFEPSYMGNVFHTETYHSGMQGKLIREGRFVTAGCIQLDRVWEKWLYDYSMNSTVYVDAGG